MPDQFAKWATTPAAPDPFAKWGSGTPETPVNADEDDGVSPWAAAAGLAGAGALAFALKKPSLLKSAGTAALDLRKMSMLSGLAPIKSLLGNVGGAAMGSIERGSLAPIREMLSMETARDAAQVFKRGPNQAIAGPSTTLSKWNLPGRVMGALDEAGQNALQRAGYSSQDAASEMLQAPLPAEWQKSLDNPVWDYLIPFRKTPYNQFKEGAATVTNALGPNGTLGQKAALGTSLATGALTGAEAEDPKTIALTTAASGRYGLPHMGAAAVARALATGSKTKAAEVARGVGPVSDYSFTEGLLRPVMQPEKLLSEPAAFSAVDYLKKFLGIQ